MALINPHINFNGNAEEAFNFYKSVFGGEFERIVRFKDISNDEYPIPEKEADKIMHIALPIGPNILMGNDVPESMGTVNENENRSKISISATSFQLAEMLNFLLATVPGVLILGCLETNTVLNGWWILFPKNSKHKNS
jgi:PhnB protein